MRVPQYKSGIQQTAEVGGQRFTVQASPATSSVALGALGNLAETATNIAFDFYEKEKKIQDESQITDLSNEYRLGVQDLFEQSKLQDPEVQDSWFNENEKKLRGQIIGRSGNRRVRNALTNDTDNVYTSIFPTVRKFANTRRIDKRLAGAFERAQLLIKDASDPNSAALRNRAYTELFGNPELGITGLYDQLQKENLVGATDALELITKAKNEVARNKVFAEFNQLRTIGQKNAYINNLQKNIPEGLDNEEARSLANSLGVEVRRQQSQYSAAVKGIKDQVKEAQSAVEEGFVYPAGSLEALEKQAYSTGNAKLISNIEVLKLTNSYSQQITSNPLAESEALVSELKRSGIPGVGLSGPETLAEQKLVKVAANRLREVKTQLNSDPKSFGVENNIIDSSEAPPLVSPNSQDQRRAFAVNRMNAQKINGLYGVPVGKAIATDAEVAEVKNFLSDPNTNTDSIVSFFGAAQTELGPHAPDFFAVIGEKENAGFYAHVGGLFSLGMKEVARKAIQGQKMSDSGLAPESPIKPTNERVTSTEAFRRLSEATALDPYTGGVGLEVANAIYLADASPVDLSTFSLSLAEQSIEKAFGAVDGKGGIESLFGYGTILPPGITGDAVEESIQMFSQKDFENIATATTGEKVELGEGIYDEITSGDFKGYNVGGNNLLLFKGEIGTPSFRKLQDKNGNDVVVNVGSIVSTSAAMIEREEAEKEQRDLEAARLEEELGVIQPGEPFAPELAPEAIYERNAPIVKEYFDGITEKYREEQRLTKEEREALRREEAKRKAEELGKMR